MALTPDAIRVLGEVMNDPKAPPATRVTAADKDRALGRPAQSVEVKGEKRDLLEYSIADLVAIAYQRQWRADQSRARLSMPVRRRRPPPRRATNPNKINSLAS